MNPKQTLLLVLSIVLTGEAIAELISDNFEYLVGIGCVLVFAAMVFSIMKRSAR